MVGEEGARDEISCETDRARFVGRGRSSISPAAMQKDAAPLSDTVGSVLDPIVSLRRTFGLVPEQTVRVDFVLGVAETREAAMALVEKYQDPLVIERCFDLARTDVALGELGATDAEAQTYARLAAALIYADPAKRAAPGVLLANRCGQSGLWKYGVSGLLSELAVYVAMDAPVKFSVLKLRNVSGRPRRISVTGFWEWVLGEQRQKNLLHVQTEVDHKTGALLARNFYNADFSEAVAFVDVADSGRTLTGDREEFLGRNGSMSNPAALKREHLSGKTGVGLDPCGALQVILDLADGEEREVRFCLGAGRTWRTRKTWSDAFAKAMPAERH